MAAVFDIYLDTGGTDNTPGAETDTDALGPPNIRFKQADDTTIDANNPMPIPAAGTEYSRWKQVYMYCATAPSTQVDNVKFYTDGGGFGTGISVKVGDGVQVKNSGASTGYDVSDTNEVITNHTDVAAATDVFSYTSGAPRTCTISEAGSIINAIGETTDYLVLSMEVINTASPGNLADETFTFQYDEI